VYCSFFPFHHVFNIGCLLFFLFLYYFLTFLNFTFFFKLLLQFRSAVLLPVTSINFLNHCMKFSMLEHSEYSSIFDFISFSRL